METLEFRTKDRDDFLEISVDIQRLIQLANIESGHVVIFVPHTTAGITINENADPDVVHDMLKQLKKMVPWNQNFYRHAEGNSASHVKASMMGSSVTVFIDAGKLVLGIWQGIYLCEFDGPRNRKVHVKIIPD